MQKISIKNISKILYLMVYVTPCKWRLREIFLIPLLYMTNEYIYYTLSNSQYYHVQFKLKIS